VAPDFSGEDLIEMGLAEEVTVDREMLAAMRAQCGDAALAPGRDINDEVGARLLVEPIGRCRILRRDGRCPEQTLHGV